MMVECKSIESWNMSWLHFELCNLRPTMYASTLVSMKDEWLCLVGYCKMPMKHREIVRVLMIFWIQIF